MSSGEFDLEFRSAVDEAWYNALVLLKNETLTIKLEDFPDCDEVFDASKFETVEKVNEFVKRFRPISVQVQDENCSSITKGKNFCATLSTLVSGFPDVRYYDVTVMDVCAKDHVVNEKNEDICKCEFMLCWQHGVKMGTITINHGVEGICQIQSCSKVDRRVATFCKLVKKQINLPQVKIELTFSRQDLKEEGRAQGLRTGVDHDRDVGGECVDSTTIKETGDQYFTMIENVEKDISPSQIIGFIKKNTRATAKAIVYPSVCESYKRAAVFSDRKEDIVKIFKFLSSSDHIIMSLKGRPWLIYEKKVQRGTILPTSANFNLEPQDSKKLKSILKVVKRGEPEFQMGEKIKDLVRGFLDHQLQLYASLEERMIYTISSISYPAS